MAADLPVGRMTPRLDCHGAFEREVPIGQKFFGSRDK